MIPLRDYHASGRFPWVNTALIAVNIIVFFYQFSLSDVPARELPSRWLASWDAAGCDVPREFRQMLRFARLSEEDLFTFRFGVVPCEITRGTDLPPLAPMVVWLTLITSMFLHAGFLHILGNMWYLWIFGDNIESVFGRLGYLGFYVVCGVAAAFAQILTSPSSTVPMVGASGAISGVLGAYLVLFPYGRILTLVPLFPFFVRLLELPALLFLGFW
ncbi:MAG: rhomboid family intramembrane serine protease, partial [Candidatus Bipolaricaulota bacterium]|nr:rhomboid family intramembrane serine protease [Candidatus Bipolaricaulota bacterium]